MIGSDPWPALSQQLVGDVGPAHPPKRRREHGGGDPSGWGPDGLHPTGRRARSVRVLVHLEQRLLERGGGRQLGDVMGFRPATRRFNG